MVRIDKYHFPDDLYYEKDHSWAKIEEGGKRVRIGIDDFGQDIAGKILFIRIRRAGSVVKQGRTYASIETGKWVGPLRSPVTGRIVEVNQALSRKPSLANEDPYGSAWFIIVEPSNLEEDLKNTYHGEAWVEYVKKDIVERLKK
ncbi:MAG: glycine cleavage system protein H [Candidatus Bathyarchaeia archaeon]